MQELSERAWVLSQNVTYTKPETVKIGNMSTITLPLGESGFCVLLLIYADERTNPTAPHSWFKVRVHVVICVGVGIELCGRASFPLVPRMHFPLLLALEARLGQR